MTIRIVTDRETYSQAGEITGTVHVTGGDPEEWGDREEQIESLRLELRELGPGGEGGTSAVVRQTSLLQDDPMTVAPGFERAYRFTIQLSQNCRLSAGGYGWQLVAVAARRLELDARTTLVLAVVPAREILAIVEACVSRLGCVETSRKWGGSRGMTRIVMQPSPALRPKIDSLQFTLTQDIGGGVGGSLLIRHARKSFLDSLRGVIEPYRRYRPRKPISLTRDEFFQASAEPNVGAIAQHIRGLIDEAIREREQTA